MASPTQWTWVWVSSRSWWWAGRPCVLQPMVLQSRTRLSNWTDDQTVQISLPHGVFLSLGYILRSGIAGTYGSSIFNFLKNFCAVFHSTYTTLQSHQQLIICCLLSLDSSHLTVVWCYLVILIGISLWLLMLITFSCTCWLFMYLLWKNVQVPCSFFYLYYFEFLLLSFRSSLYILNTNALLDTLFANISPIHQIVVTSISLLWFSNFSFVSWTCNWFLSGLCQTFQHHIYLVTGISWLCFLIQIMVFPGSW